MSSKLLFLRPLPIFVSPCRKEFDLLSKMSSMTRKELDLPLWYPATVGLSGKDKEFDLVVTKGGARVGWKVDNPSPEPLRLPSPAICWIKVWEQKLMFDFLLLLCLSKVFWAENGLGLTKYLKMIFFNQISQFVHYSHYISFF